MLVVLSGTGRAVVNGESLEFGEGSVLFAERIDEFRVLEGELLLSFMLCFDRVYMDHFLLHYPFGRKFDFLGDLFFLELEMSRLSQVIARFFDLRRELESGSTFEHMKLWFSLMMLDVIGDLSEQAVGIDFSHQLLADFSGLLEDNFREQRNCGFYAGKLGITMRKLNNLCRSWFLGRNFAQVHRQRLLSEAEYMLLNSVKPIKEIAYELEFCSQQHFRGYFYRAKGISPLRFRQLEKVGAEGQVNKINSL